MPVIDKEYEEITLKDNHLKDPLLMALAWKKSHQYIRSTNWYADNFELDISALNLIQCCKDWASSLVCPIDFSELELVPAPKASKWEFVESKQPNTSGALFFDFVEKTFDPVWQPKLEQSEGENRSPLKLRPLAHIPIREQSMMTLLMMGLATGREHTLLYI